MLIYNKFDRLGGYEQQPTGCAEGMFELEHSGGSWEHTEVAVTSTKLYWAATDADPQAR